MLSAFEAVKECATKSWTAIGPLLGVLVGAYISSRNQKRQWGLDNKRAEYRELLTTLTECGSELMSFPTGELADRRRIDEIARLSVNVIYNRLFVADMVISTNLMKRWRDCISDLRTSKNINAFRTEFDSIMNDIRSVAKRDLS